MLAAVKKLEFEKAALLRDQISFLKDGGKNLKFAKAGGFSGRKKYGNKKGMEKRNLKYSILNLLLLLPFSILHSELISKKKLLFHFDKIEVNGKVDVFLTSGKRTREAKIYADSEIIDSVVTHVSQKTLYIDANNSYKLSRRLPFIRLKAERTFPVEVIISIDKLSEIRLLGQSSLTTQKLVSRDLSLFTSSTGKMHLENISIPELTIIHNGTGDIVLKEMCPN